MFENLLKRSPSSYGEFEDAVAEIVENVRNNKDAAVFEYTKRFDVADINAGSIKVTKEEIDEAYEQVDPSLLDVIRKALVNIREYHEKQKNTAGLTANRTEPCWTESHAACKVGVYVPGGKAVYPSSVLMNVVPAKVAGGEDHHDDPLAERTEKCIRPHLLPLWRQEPMKSTKWVVPRRLQPGIRNREYTKSRQDRRS